MTKTLAVHEELISRLPDLYESRFNYEADGTSDADYISGLIDGYITALGLLGIPNDLIPTDPYEEA